MALWEINTEAVPKKIAADEGATQGTCLLSGRRERARNPPTQGGKERDNDNLRRSAIYSGPKAPTGAQGALRHPGYSGADVDI